MTSPENPPVEPASGPAAEPVRHSAQRRPRPGREIPFVAWAKAVLCGAKDTAEEMLAEGRRGAHAAYEEAWHRFDEKTKHRRDRDR